MLLRSLFATLGMLAWAMPDLEARAQPTVGGSTLEDRCASQAQKIFVQMGGAREKGDLFQSHYNTVLNKCLMSIELRREASTFKDLIDAFEQRPYALSFWMADPARQGVEALPKLCVLIEPVDKKRNCSSTGEYEDFVASYMAQ